MCKWVGGNYIVQSHLYLNDAVLQFLSFLNLSKYNKDILKYHSDAHPTFLHFVLFLDD